MNWLVVTPSVRPFNADFFEPIQDVDWVIVDDSDGQANLEEVVKKGPARKGMTMIADEQMMIKTMGSNAYKRLVSRHNPSCKSFGLWFAYKNRYDGVILLDDDCDLRVTPDYMNKIPVGRLTETVQVHTPYNWYNPLDQVGRGMYARGFPYPFRNGSLSVQPGRSVFPAFNEGLWCGTPDINGIDKIEMLQERNMEWGLEKSNPWYLDPETTRVLPSYVQLKTNQKLPLSIMNVQLLTSLLPAFWQPPDFAVHGGFRIRRHDDVYAMLILKKLMDLKGEGHMVTVGEPMIYHTKAGNPFREAVNEHCTHLFQPVLEEAVDCAIEHMPWSPGDSYAELAMSLAIQMERTVLHNSYQSTGTWHTIQVAYAKGLFEWAKYLYEGR